MNDRALLVALVEIFGALLRDIPTKTDLEKLGDNIMSKISDYTDQVNEHLKTIEDAHAGIADDVRVIKERLEQIDQAGGPISADDQKKLDEALARVGAVAAKLKTLDEATAQVPTPPPVTEGGDPETPTIPPGPVTQGLRPTSPRGVSS